MENQRLLDRPAVKRVRDALAAAGSTATVIELAETARTAADAAASIGVEQGAIVKSLFFAAPGGGGHGPGRRRPAL